MSLERSVTKEQAKEFLESYSIALGKYVPGEVSNQEAG